MNKKWIKKWWSVIARSGSDERKFNVFTTRNHIDRVAEKTAKNIFYCENVIIISIN